MNNKKALISQVLNDFTRNPQPETIILVPGAWMWDRLIATWYVSALIIKETMYQYTPFPSSALMNS
jgi:hypothetical protein